MHPAFSVIFFTTASGAGYGLLFLTGLFNALGLLPRDAGFGAAALALSLILITAGLLASTAHLGHPKRAWRAMSQWRSSWLAREGVAALATYVPAGLFGIGWVLFDRPGGAVALLGLLAAAGAVVTVYCTGMIYASLKPIHQWHNRWVVPGYMALALLTGALWLFALVLFWGVRNPLFPVLAVLAVPLAASVKERYWRFIDESRAASTPETATGLLGRGKVRLLDPPHTEENYLLKEMGYRVARKHAVKLRRITLGAGMALPGLLVLLSALAPNSLAAILALAAALSAMLGVLVERWLFFAEAKHTVTLYYGAAEA